MRCFYQIFGRQTTRPPGWGNCDICTPDDKNKNCPGYIRISVMEVTIEPKRTEESEENKAR